MSEKRSSNNIPPPAKINRIIHEPARLLILAYLSVVETADFLFMERQTGLTRGNLSSHLAKLESAGYIEINKQFVEKIPRTLLKITTSGTREFKKYQQQMRGLLDEFSTE
jgi:DNA-binding transcriptional ArsR family regulator